MATSTKRGCVAMAVMPAAISSNTEYGRRICRSIVLKLRNRIVLTISSAGTSTRASTSAFASTGSAGSTML